MHKLHKLIQKFHLKRLALAYIALEILMAAVVFVIGASALEAEAATTVYHNFTLIDPQQHTVSENAYLVVSDEKIIAVGQGSQEELSRFQADDIKHQDMGGTFALPGFFDAHAHITAGPLSVKMEIGKPALDMSSQDILTQHNALLALAFGVTSVRNPAGDPIANQRYSQQVTSGEWLGPQALHAGLTFDPVPIRGGSVYPKTVDEWNEEIARQKALGMHYIKLYHGLSEKEVALGIKPAHEHGMKTIAHLDQVSWITAIDAGIDALTHALPTSADLLMGEEKKQYLESRHALSSKFYYQWFEYADYDSEPIQTLVIKLTDNKILVDLTLGVNDITYFFDKADSRYPKDFFELPHPAQMENWHSNMQASHFGWTKDDYQRAHAVFPKVLAFAKLLHDNKVPLLIGTDGYGGGPGYAYELELHRKAGLSNWEVLALATHLSAERLGLGQQTGSLQVGKEADIVFLNSNPLLDIGNTKDVNTTLVDGEAYSKQELLKMAKQLGRKEI